MGIKILATFRTETSQPASRVPDVRSLNLPAEAEQFIAAAVDDNKMDWELWIQSAENFENLRDLLAKRGYSRLPNATAPLYRPEPGRKMEAVTKHLGKSKTMLRKIID